MASHDKVAIITGAGSGIGRAVAIAFLKGGYRTVLAGRRGDALEETIALSGVGQGRALAVPTDVADKGSVEKLFAKTKAAFGRVDVLFNNAGINAPGSIMLEDLALEDWRRVVDTNLTGPFLCTQEAFKAMKAQEPRGGRIINNGSISAHAPRPNSVAYTATKHAITGLTKTAALDGRKYDIAVGQVDIGNALTEMARRMTMGVPQADGSIKVEPVMDVENVATTVLHMAGLPLEANVLFVTVMATKAPLVGRG
ncbi:SDR family oxidoreductase [Bosea sp. (in: a-proteobacteria)]|uniref:SDR family oxidoreductase n=1 Tax=Bosea sp. (in: a-proteobacteria) TaxID=1871050 RepID=UPI0026039FE6|nr:SDR family oxidoreductase [Bosea sp. (in: a-proteobacteria)]MCO5093427.1 SDR family oxidoreductase [Bosea sp. (in: a-proteobacteria)]